MDRSRPARLSAAEFRALVAGRKAVTSRPAHRAWGGRERATPAEPVRVLLPFLPPSVNKLFATVRDQATGALRRVLTAHARRVRRLILGLVRGHADPEGLYELFVTVRLRAFNSDGGVRKVDLTNRIKFLEDCVCAALGIDDSRVFRVVMLKQHADEEQTCIELRPMSQPGRMAA